MPSVYIETYGCQMNLADTEIVLGHLARCGYVRAGEPSRADVILVNTCAIREHAEGRVLGRLGDLARYKLRRPHVRIGLAGCMAQHVRDRLMNAMPHLDFVVGPDAYRRLPELLGGDQFMDVRLDRDETYADITPERDGGVRAWITIMRGCDKFCTFCIVPYVRGRERSLPVAAVLDQVRSVASQGYREVVFLGQTVNAYRDGAIDFATLLRVANAVDGIARIRFTSPHPSDMTAPVIEAMAACEKVCPQVHLPVQTGADAVLTRMARGYTREGYLALVERLRAMVPDVALSTDIIVGFPGETEADFEATLDLLRVVRFDSAFMFTYSRREPTKAAKWSETVSGAEKSRRLQAVIALQERIAAEVNAAMVGRNVEVLVEGPARRRAGWVAGKTPQFKTTVFPDCGARPGEVVQVGIAESTAHTLIGTAVSS
ncbi:MAG: tRNA (N6-isopentenyl adenosine(37)-C2)-methylthiotransferase MiaB [Acidobacteria bacterium RBG_16_68_9]|nr:MAG: tRNA (N6-isopentenyl adenosine(37)-C2)-methylthiotransferase MiaB [Acidobacteria bacterium RBG_16_68_9]